jgi:hypothetical protein
MLDNVGSLTYHNPIGFQGLLRDSLPFTSTGEGNIKLDLKEVGCEAVDRIV